MAQHKTNFPLLINSKFYRKRGLRGISEEGGNGSLRLADSNRPDKRASITESGGRRTKEDCPLVDTPFPLSAGTNTLPGGARHCMHLWGHSRSLAPWWEGTFWPVNEVLPGWVMDVEFGAQAELRGGRKTRGPGTGSQTLALAQTP